MSSHTFQGNLNLYDSAEDMDVGAQVHPDETSAMAHSEEGNSDVDGDGWGSDEPRAMDTEENKDMGGEGQGLPDEAQAMDIKENKDMDGEGQELPDEAQAMDTKENKNMHGEGQGLPDESQDVDISEGYTVNITLKEVESKEAEQKENSSGARISESEFAFQHAKMFYIQHQEKFKLVSSPKEFAALESEMLKTRMSKFSQYATYVIRGLQLLSQVYPIVGVVIAPFNMVINVVQAQEKNDSKVLRVRWQISNTIMYLWEILNIKTPDLRGPDFQMSMKHDLFDLMENIAKDITEAMSLCNQYQKKSKLEMEELKSKIFQILEKLDTPREKEIKMFIKRNHGVNACLQDDQLLEKLIDLGGEPISDITFKPGNKAQNLKAARKKLLEDFREDISKVIQQNLSSFTQRMEIQEKLIKETIENSFQIHNDSLLTALQKGSHDQIIDPDMQKLWKVNAWKNSVKARHFVLALQEFYQDSSANPRFLMSSTSPTSSHSEIDKENKAVHVPEVDQWAINYLDISHVQSILEAIDDDGTGFITIKEVNKFALSRPKGWSLPVWIAYWAVGWHVDMVQYKRKIHAIMLAMFDILDYDVHKKLSNDKRHLPSNRYNIDWYLYNICPQIDILVRSLHPLKNGWEEDDNLQQIIQQVSTQKERRFQEILETIKYNIDMPSTVALVIGSGSQIEQSILPLIYLVLKRHLNILYLCQTNILHDKEFGDMGISLMNIFAMLDDRIEILSVYEKLHLSYNDSENWQSKNMLYSWFEERDDVAIFDETETKETLAHIQASAKEILKYGTSNTWDHQIHERSLSTFHPQQKGPSDSQHLLSGYWTGRLDTDTNTLCGRYELEERDDDNEDGQDGQDSEDENTSAQIIQTIFFTRNPLLAWRHRTPLDQQDIAPRARWNFVLNTVVDQIRQQNCSLTFVNRWMLEQKHFLKLGLRLETEYQSPSNPLTPAERREFEDLKAKLHPANAQLYYSMITHTAKVKSIEHLFIGCNKCERQIVQSRLICLECTPADCSNTFDLCMACQSSFISNELLHTPSHTMLKVNCMVHNEKAWAIPQARELAARVKDLFYFKQYSEQPGTGESSQSRNSPKMFCAYCSLPTVNDRLSTLEQKLADLKKIIYWIFDYLKYLPNKPS
ncbi:hypothetical protein F5878DRAFT_645514 [Lentinula raphanica]|uniref:EF-hand domain-containing protein n=1 Tax=Lentinula raphanica TaxID=153919 RepID=A0AA38U873_9AGAR|nr:hypothetical protein F5878DRAFT_645514 [Lentinula raphanica]